MTSDFDEDHYPQWLQNFLIIWGGQSLSLLSSAVTRFSLIWWLAQETDSVRVLATAAIFGLAPDIVVLPLVGALVDRWDRRRIMLVADGSMMLLTLTLAALFATNSMTLPHVYFYQMATSVGQMFHRTAMIAATRQLVPLRFIPRVQGLNTFLWGLFSLLPPPLAALLLAALDLHSILMLDVATACISMAPLLFLRLPGFQGEDHPAKQNQDHEGFREHFLGGIHYLVGHRGLQVLLIYVAMGGLLLTPLVTYLPLLVKNHFGGGARELGWIESAWGAGILCGGALYGLRKTDNRQVVIMLSATLGVGLGYSCLALLPGNMPDWAYPIMLAIGLLCAIIAAPINTIFQSRVPVAVMGRVWVIYELCAGIFSPIGLAITAMLTDDWFGVRELTLICGLLYSGCAAAGFFIPALRSFDHGTGEKESVSLGGEATPGR